MPYFTAVVARDGAKWSARTVDVDSVADAAELSELTTQLQLATKGTEPILVLIEREDAWWAVLRVDGDEDPRVFASDVEGVANSPYAGLLELGADPLSGRSFGGDLDVLSDLGTSPEDLRATCEDEALPLDVMSSIAEAAGFAEVLDSLR